MKIHHFGLWFHHYDKGKGCEEWSTSIPQDDSDFGIYFDGQRLGRFWGCGENKIFIHICYSDTISLTKDFPRVGKHYKVGHPLSLDDFEIIENPNYRSFT